MFKTSLRGVAVAVTLAAASVAAHADIAINTTLNFDSVADGSSANAYLSSLGLGSVMSFGNGATEADVDAFGSYTGTFHWYDATSQYGDVLVNASSAAVSGSNVLANGFEPILVQFAGPVDLASFSVQLDNNNWSTPLNVLQFLDSTGHAITGTDLPFSDVSPSGFTVSSNGPVYGVSAVLLSFGSRNFDNLSIATTTAVPEPSTWALATAALTLIGVARRRRQG